MENTKNGVGHILGYKENISSFQKLEMLKLNTWILNNTFLLGEWGNTSLHYKIAVK